MVQVVSHKIMDLECIILLLGNFYLLIHWLKTIQVGQLILLQWIGPIANIDLDGLEAVNGNSLVNINDAPRLETEESIIITLNENVRVIQSKLNSRVVIEHKYEGDTFEILFNRSGTRNRFVCFAFANPKATSLIISIRRSLGDNKENAVDHNFSLKIQAITGKSYNEIQGAGIGNTFRHFVFQSILGIQTNENVAKRIGDFHEREDIENGEFQFEDQIADLINNHHARDFLEEINVDRLESISSPEGTSNFLNQVVRQVLDSDDIYNTDSRFNDIINGNEDLFSPEDQEVIDLSINIQQYIQTRNANRQQ